MSVAKPLGFVNAVRLHWPEYLMEAAGLGLFMVSACTFGSLLFHPESPVVQAFADPTLRRVLMGLAMAATNVALIYSPWGKQSGAHFNPAVTLTFFRLGKVAPADTAFYGAAQFLGGLAGVFAASLVLGDVLAHAAVNYVTTMPGAHGAGIAFATEVLMTFVLMSVVLEVSNRPRWARYTGLCAASLVFTYISLLAPLSGMSMNPARSTASAAAAQVGTALWVYFTAPVLGMLAAAQAYLWRQGRSGVFCAKLHHQNPKRCIFCAYHYAPQPAERPKD
jgi:aquaporin Z